MATTVSLDWWLLVVKIPLFRQRFGRFSSRACYTPGNRGNGKSSLLKISQLSTVIYTGCPRCVQYFIVFPFDFPMLSREFSSHVWWLRSNILKTHAKDIELRVQKFKFWPGFMFQLSVSSMASNSPENLGIWLVIECGICRYRWDMLWISPGNQTWLTGRSVVHGHFLFYGQTICEWGCSIAMFDCRSVGILKICQTCIVGTKKGWNCRR